jgi:mRNA (2'-O-methyladenosine-N6-)-methyltransferase
MLEQKKRKRPEYPSQTLLSSSIPPTTPKELKQLVIDLLLKEALRLPFDSFTLLRYIKKGFRSVENSVYVLSKLKINDVIRELLEVNAIKAETICINMRRAYFIKDFDDEKLKQLKLQLDMDAGITQEKYLEKALVIMKEVLNETHCDYDEDDYRNFLNKYDYNYKKPRNDSLYGGQKMLVQQTYIQTADEIKAEEIDPNDINNLIYKPTAVKMMNSSHLTDAQSVMDTHSATYLAVLQKMQSKYLMRPFCSHGTKNECVKKSKGASCESVHFRPIIKQHTDLNLGDCSYLDTCRHMEICKFVHYAIEEENLAPSNRKELVLSGIGTSLPSQWINCDIRFFDLSILGKYDVIMADPPWDIHMDLPYGTLSDEEMRGLKIRELQDEGVIFLWVTGRATELARECLEHWGYERKEELVWIKTNQLQRLIRTGRTGHWLNHSKEHCLIGYKGNPKLNRNIDCDVLVSEVRETSRKPDEIYELIERMRPGGRKIELFARPHNRRYGWLSLGNQLPGAYLLENDIIERFNKSYPEHALTREQMEKNKEVSIITKEVIVD